MPIRNELEYLQSLIAQANHWDPSQIADGEGFPSPIITRWQLEVRRCLTYFSDARLLLNRFDEVQPYCQAGWTADRRKPQSARTLIETSLRDSKEY